MRLAGPSQPEPTPEIITRDEARLRGLKRFFDGTRCPRGHLSERNLRGGCIECRRTGVQLAPETEAWTGRFTCTEEVDEYLGGQTIHCLLCWQPSIRMLALHLRRAHAMSTEVYKTRFGVPADRSLNPVDLIRARSAATATRRREAADWAPRGPDPRLGELQWQEASRRIAAGELIRLVCDGRDGMPTERQWYGRRRRDDTLIRVQGRHTILTPHLADVIVEKIRAGRSAAQAAADVSISPWLVYSLKKRSLAFQDRVRGNWAPRGGVRLTDAARAERGLERERLRLDRLAPFRAQEEFRVALRSDEVYGAVHSATSRLPVEIRDDVISDLVVAILDGDIGIADLPREVGRYRAAHNRKFNAWAPSLDAPIGEGRFTLGGSFAAAYI